MIKFINLSFKIAFMKKSAMKSLSFLIITFLTSITMSAYIVLLAGTGIPGE